MMPPVAMSSAQRSMIASLASRVEPVLASGIPRSRQVMCGPQAKQASGCAWKRRSSGSAYSRAQSGHMGNADMEVAGRS